MKNRQLCFCFTSFLIIIFEISRKENLKKLTIGKEKMHTFKIFMPHYFYAAAAPIENFDAAPAPTQPYCKLKFVKGIKANIRSGILFSSDSV
jgi:hypothetical protein